MGNRASSSSTPAGPPPALAAAVMGDYTAFEAAVANDEASFWSLTDSQDNNLLHALFSCRPSQEKKADCVKILHKTHHHVDNEKQLLKLYQAQNQLGCNPLWILVAYGNVPLLKAVVATSVFQDSSNQQLLTKLLMEAPNHQDDSSFLATCSQGNLEMARYLYTEFAQPANLGQAILLQANAKGTTPLQIAVGNRHEGVVEFLLQHLENASDVVLHKDASSELSLFHICSERNFDQGLALLLQYTTPAEALNLRDKNGATALHVAAYCGNAEATQRWIDAVKEQASSDDDKKSLLDAKDTNGRTAYWLAQVEQTHTSVAKLLADAGVETAQPEQMLEEIRQAQERRAAKASTGSKPLIDGQALLSQR